MRCLYCGKELALFKRLRGGEFCSDAHRQKYQEEYTQLALNRLLQANSPQEKDSAAAKPQELRPAEPESPALKRRERLGREDAPAEAPAFSTPLASEPQQTAVLDPEPAAVAIPALVTPAVEEPAPAGISGFLVEVPVPAAVEVAAPSNASANLERIARLALPRLQVFPRETAADRLEPAGPIALAVCALTDFQTPPRERGLELREFVRGVPQVEIRVRPASETGFEPVREALELHVAACPPNDPRLWQAFEEGLPPLSREAEILLDDLARLDFEATGWDEGGESAAGVQQPPLAGGVPVAIGNARIEPMRVEPVQLDPAPRESSRLIERLEPLRFEPVHVDPVFMERIAGAAEFNALKSRTVRETPAVETGPEPVATLATVASAMAEAVAAETPAPAAPAPPTITKPVTVTLHGLAPARGKPVQVFTSVVSRGGDVQVPRETGLPLRPTMVLGPAPNPISTPASVPSGVPSNSDGKAAEKPVRSIPVPERRDSRPTEIKPRRSEVRILPVQVKAEALQRQKEPVKTEPVVKPEPVKVAPAGTPEPLKEPPAAAAAPKETPAEKPQPAPAPVEIKPSAPVPEEAKTRTEPLEEPDLLGLPKLSFQHSENFWSRLPVLVRIGAIAFVLALIVGGVVLTSRGSGAPKPPAPANHEPQVVEAGSALANTGGWMPDWFVDHPGSQLGRHVDVLRGTLTLRDYRLLFEGEIEHGALGWVFRANDKSFYVEKIQVVAPGLEPAMALVHFAVVDGQEQQRVQIPLPFKTRIDTVYKVRMDAVGSRFTTWVQDQMVAEWTDSQIGAGGVGLYYDSGDSARLKDTLNVIPLKLK